MATSHSYGATLENNKTENQAVQFLLAQNPCFRVLSKDERKKLLSSLGLESSFSRAFDLVRVPSAEVIDIFSVPVENLILIELKTTKKKLINNPAGFFFGATENEINLAKKLGDRYKFCFISLHAESSTYALLTWKELDQKIKHQRIQYQINLKNESSTET